MKPSERNNIKDKFEQLVSKDKLDYEFDELMLSMRIISEVDRLMEAQNMAKKDLAKALKTSAAYITQLFRGNKILNLYTIARLQEIFNVDFRINAESREVDNEKIIFDHIGNFPEELDLKTTIKPSTVGVYNNEVQESHEKGKHLKVVANILEAA